MNNKLYFKNGRIDWYVLAQTLTKLDETLVKTNKLDKIQEKQSMLLNDFLKGYLELV